MPVNRRFTKFVALPLAAAALAAGIATGTQPVGAQTGTDRVCSTTTERGYPNAVPPILPPPPCSALGAIHRQEAFEGREFRYDPPTNARYSNAEVNTYASTNK